MKNKSIKSVLCLIFSIFLVSCQVGLGTGPDQVPPKLSVNSPDVNENVLDVITIDGIAKDDSGISFIELKILETNQFFRFNGSSFLWEEKKGDSFVNYSEDDCFFSGDIKDFEWSITVKISDPNPSGKRFTIVTHAFDPNNNDGKSAIDERVVTVDIMAPSVSINEPVIETDLGEAVSDFDLYELRDNNVLSKLMNKDVTISGLLKDDSKLKSLSIYLDGERSRDVNKEDLESTYKRWDIPEDSLRSWSITVKESDLPESVRSGKHLFRIITESYDEAGNSELKVQGWFIYWNQADIPWLVANIGGESLESAKNVYPRSNLQGQAYDDDGIGEIAINIYKKLPADENFTLDTEESFVTRFPLPKTSEYPKYYSWAIEAPGETCSIYAEISIKDKFGLSGEKIVRYMNIEDVNPPKIIIDEPVSGTVLLGDEKGDFTLSGRIEDDGDIKDYLKFVRIADGKEVTETKYFTNSYEEWEKATEEGAIDGNENKIWKIPLDTDDGELTDEGLHKRTFSKTFNLFEDFGIGSDQKMKSQTFILYAEDEGDVSCINYYTYTGDVDAPVLTIDSIEIVHNDNTSDLIEFDGETKTLDPFERDNDGIILDKAILRGTWSDNSTNNWNEKSKINSIEIQWEGTSVTVNKKNNGTWQTEEITIPDNNTASIVASLTDYAGNTGKAESSFFINSSVPVLTRVTSTNNDGSYSAGEIIISMDFNKNVTFRNGSESPVLYLNNGKTASYVGGNGTSKHLYEYTVSANDDTEALSVTGITINNNKWFDESNTKVENIESLPYKENLGGRTIVIDTRPPLLERITSATTGHYGKGKEIYITATFSEDVIISDVESMYLSLNSGEDVKTSSATKTGQKAVLFKYIVGDGENASPLKASLNLNATSVTDAAGNTFAGNSSSFELSGVIIDTEPPRKPIINYEGENICYNPEGLEFSIDYDSSASIKKYSLDGGSSYMDYPNSGNIKITNNGNYTIKAYAEDAAGNRVESDEKYVTLDAGYFLNTIRTNRTDGIYSVGEIFEFILSFRKEVDVSPNSTLTLNISNQGNTSVEAECISISGLPTKEIRYSYTVKENDTCGKLDVIAINGSFKDENGIDVTDYVSLEAIEEDKKFINNCDVEINTVKPSISSVELISDDDGNNAKIEITFNTNSQLTKGSGNIIIQQDEGSYLAPAVLSVADYKEYEDVIGSFYEEGTNGAFEDGTSDTSKKYILKFDYDGTSEVVKTAFKGTTALSKTIDIASRYVTIADNVMTVDLSEGYALPVKGAMYIITVPAGIVYDSLEQTNEEGFTKNSTLSGNEKPVIRINKKNEEISNSIAQQPLTAEYKIDCQTPASTIFYTIDETEYTSDTISQATIEGYYKNNTKYSKKEGSKVSGVEKTYTSSATNVIGNAENYTNGYKYFISARVGDVYGYEVAYRSVIILTATTDSLQNGAGGFDSNHIPVIGGEGNYSNPGNLNAVYVRGGDSLFGGVTTPGFPFSWDPGQYDKVRLMTRDDDEWYWVTWNINATAYFGFLAGNVPADATDNGPTNWSWATCGFVGLKEKYPLYPGHSINMATIYSNRLSNDIGALSGKWVGDFTFQYKQLQQRNGTAYTQQGEYVAPTQE